MKTSLIIIFANNKFNYKNTLLTSKFSDGNIS